MRLHARAALTLKQRQEIKRLHEEEGISVRKLAQRYNVSIGTINKWLHRESPLDRSSMRINPSTVITPEYRSAVLSYRQENPHHGPIRIAEGLHSQFPFADRGNVWRILHAEGLARPKVQEKREQEHIPVGRHRIQMDIQQLPAVEGGKGFEYKITAIHLRTRLKYSEIHPDRRSKTVAGVLERALDFLPPFSLSGATMPSSSP